MGGLGTRAWSLKEVCHQYHTHPITHSQIACLHRHGDALLNLNLGKVGKMRCSCRSTESLSMTDHAMFAPSESDNLSVQQVWPPEAVPSRLPYTHVSFASRVYYHQIVFSWQQPIRQDPGNCIAHRATAVHTHEKRYCCSMSFPLLEVLLAIQLFHLLPTRCTP